MFKGIYICTIFGLLLLGMQVYSPQKTILKDWDDDYKDRVFLFISMAWLCLLHLLKDPYSFSDNPVYARLFEHYKHIDLLHFIFHSKEIAPNWEPGFIVLLRLLSIISNSPNILFILSSIFYLYVCASVIQRYTPSGLCWLSVMFLLVGTAYIDKMYLQRQVFAICFVTLSYSAVINKKLFNFLFLILTAFFFHTSSIIFLPVFFIYWIKNDRLRWIVIVVGFFLFFMLYEFFKVIIIDAQGRYAHYFNDSGMSWKPFMRCLLYFVLRIFVFGKDFFKEGTIRLFSIMTVLALIVGVFGLQTSGTFIRLNAYFEGMMFLTVPQTLSYISEVRVKRLLTISLLLILSFLFVRSLYNVPWYQRAAFLW